MTPEANIVTPEATAALTIYGETFRAKINLNCRLCVDLPTSKPTLPLQMSQTYFWGYDGHIQCFIL